MPDEKDGAVERCPNTLDMFSEVDERLAGAMAKLLDRMDALEATAAEPRINSLYPKLFRIMQAVERVERRGRNTQYNYDYITEEDMVNACRKAMAAEQVIRVPVEYTSMGSAKDDHVRLKSRWVDIETGDFLDVSIDGRDINGGNKATWAAYTGALKYELRHLCMVPTGDDPEKDQGRGNRDSRTRSGSPATPGPAAGGGNAPPAGQPGREAKPQPVSEDDVAMLEEWTKVHESLRNYYNAYGLKMAEGTKSEPGILKLYEAQGPDLKVRPRGLQKAREVYAETRARAEADGVNLEVE